jgi:hypothetical protein
MWNWSAALGGNLTDDQLRERQRQIANDETITDGQQQIAEIDNILTQRQSFRDALALANAIVAHADLSPEEQMADGPKRMALPQKSEVGLGHSQYRER